MRRGTEKRYEASAVSERTEGKVYAEIRGEESWGWESGLARLKNDAALAASTVVRALLGLESLHAAGTRGGARRTGSPHGLLLVVSSDLAHEVAECLVDVDALLG